MAFFKIDNVKIAGISACVPPKQVENIDSILIEDKKELEKYIETTESKEDILPKRKFVLLICV